MRRCRGERDAATATKTPPVMRPGDSCSSPRSRSGRDDRRRPAATMKHLPRPSRPGLTDIARAPGDRPHADDMKTIQFKLNGEARQFETWPDQLFIEVLRETFKIKSVKVGLLAAAGMRLLPDADRRPAEARLRGPRRAGPGPLGHHARRRLRQRAAPLRRRLPGRRRPAMRVLHAGPRPAHQVDDRSGREAYARRDRAAARRASLPLHRLREDPRRGRTHPGGQARRRRCRPIVEDGGVGKPLRRYQGAELALGERPFVADIDAPGLLYGVVVLSPHARARIVTHRRLEGAGASRGRRGRDRRRRAGRPLGRTDLRRLALSSSPRARRRAMSATCSRRSPPKRRASPARPRRWSRSNTSRLPRCSTPPRRSSRARRRSIPSTTTCSRRRATRAATSRRRSPRPRMSSAATGRRSASSTCSSSRRRASPARCPTAACTSRARARASSRIAGRSPPSSASRRSGCSSSSSPNGGAFGGKEDMTIQAQTALLARLTGRPVRIELTREESIRMHPKRHPMTMTYTVGCDAEGRLTGGEDRHSRRFRRLRLGRRQGAGARRRPRLRALPDAGARQSRRSPPTPTIRPAARCAASASTRRASPSRAASTCSPPRSASTAGRCAGGTSSGSAT